MKIMEIVDKTDDFKQDITKLKLLETSFTSYGKYIGTDPGSHWTSWATNDIFSVEGLKSLNRDQESLVTNFQPFVDDHNAWVDSVSGWLPLTKITWGLPIEDWSATYLADTTMASYAEVLSDIAMAERTIYEGVPKRCQDTFNGNQNSLEEWSKGRQYWSNIASVTTPTYNSEEDTWVCGYFEIVSEAGHGITCEPIPSSNGRGYVKLSTLENVPVGTTFSVGWKFVVGDISCDPTGQFAEMLSTFRKDANGASGDDGVLVNLGTEVVDSANLPPEIGDDISVSLKGNPSPHMVANHTPSETNLQWFKSRVFL